MRNLFAILLMACSMPAFAQVGNFSRVTVRDSINLRGKWVSAFDVTAISGLLDSLNARYDSTKLQTPGQSRISINNLSYIPGYTQAINKLAGNSSLTNPYSTSSGFGGFFTNNNTSTDYPDSAGSGMIMQRASTATSVSSRGSWQLWTSAAKGVPDGLYFRKTDVNGLTGNIWGPWRKLIDSSDLSGGQYLPLSVRCKDDTVYVRSRYSDEKDKVQLFAMRNANNQAIILGTYLISTTDSILSYKSGTTISTGTDNTPPLQFTYLGNISGNHGVEAINATIEGDKDIDDIGSVWSDGTYQYFLAEITDATHYVFMSRPYNYGSEIGIRRGSFASTTLTHVSGAIHTNDISILSQVTLQRFPVTFNNQQSIILDGKTLTEDGEYFGFNLQIIDRYEVVDPTTYVATSPFQWNNGSSLASINMAYKMGQEGTILSDYSIKFNSNHRIINTGLLQVQKLPVGGTFSKLFDYIPNAAPKTVGSNTYNFSFPTNMSTNPPVSIYLTKSDMIHTDRPANRMVQLLTNSSNVSQVGSAHGYNITYGSGASTERINNNVSDLWYISTANKSYPRLASGIMSNYRTLYGSAYFTFFNPLENDSLTACYIVPSGDEYLLFLDAHQDLTNYNVKVPSYLTGRSINVLEENGNMTLLTTDIVPAGGLTLSNKNGSGYLILTLSGFNGYKDIYSRWDSVTVKQHFYSKSESDTRFILNQSSSSQNNSSFNVAGGGNALHFKTKDTSRATGSGLYYMYNGSSNAPDKVRWITGMTGVEGQLNSGADYFLSRYDSSGSYLSSALYIRRADGYTGFNTTAPFKTVDINGGLAIRSTATGSTALTDSLLVKSKNGEVKVIGIKSRLISGNLFDKDSVSVGQYIDPSSGSLQTGAGYAVSGYIQVDASTQYVFSKLGTIHYGLGVAFYNSDKDFVNRTNTAQDVTTANITTPATAFYLRFTCKTGKPGDNMNVDSVRLEAGTVPTSFTGAAVNAITSINSLQIASNYTTQDPVDSSSTVNLRYFLKHSSATAPKTSGKKLLTFGDSITATETENGTPVTNWPTYAVPIMGVELRNFAQSGASFIDWGTPIPRQQLSRQINDAVDSAVAADIIVVSIGTNDFNRFGMLGDYDTAMSRATLADLDRTKIIEAARWAFWQIRTQWPAARCFYGMPLQRASREYKDMVWLLDAIRDMANRYGFKIIEATNESGIVKDFESVGSNGRYLSDGLHPNTAGKQLMGAYYANEIMNDFFTY